MEIQVKVEELKKRSLFIGTPMYGGKCDFNYVKGLTDLLQTLVGYQIPYKLYFLAQESLITRARNYIVDEFMRSGMSHMVFIDSDIGFDPESVLTMLALADPEDSCDKDILCGPYPKKTIAWEKIKVAVDRGFADDNPNVLDDFVGDYVFNPAMGQNEINIQEPVEVLEGGTGFMLIQRKAFEKFADHYPQYLYTPDHVRTESFDGSRQIMQYFHCEIDEKSNRYLSEDYWFCQKSREVGIKTWLLPWMRLTHMGAFVFGGSLAAIAAAGVSPTADPREIDKTKKKKLLKPKKKK